MNSYFPLIWIILGLVLLGLEQAFAAGFYLFFFGVAAILTGVLAALGVLPGAIVQLVVFIAATLSLVYFREQLLGMFGKGGAAPKDDFDSPVGGVGEAAQEIAAGGHGKINFRGSSWSAKNVGSDTVSAGERVKVQAVDGLVLNISKE